LAAAVATVVLTASAVRADVGPATSSLSMNRIFAPGNEDIVQFTGLQQPAGASSAQPSFAFSLSLTPPGRAGAQLFGSGTFAPALVPQPALGSPGALFGLHVNLLGGESTLALEGKAPAWQINPAADAGPVPAVFPFYTPNARAPETTEIGTSSLALPLVNAFTQQGPYWLGGGYSPGLQGSFLQLSVPVRIARVGVKLNVGEQSLSTVGTSPLSTQIFGPAFASSAANYNSVNGGVTLALPLLNRRATISLDGLYQSLQQSASAYGGTSAQAGTLFGGLALPASVFVYPGTPGAPVLQQYLGIASLAVPVGAHLTVKGSFSSQLAGNVDLNTLTQNLTQHAMAYGGGLVYDIPRTNGSINLYFNRNIYPDDASPLAGLSQSSQNLYFSVKF
jgi:hypothetical protein